MHTLRFRQIHLDFHTSEHIPGIGKAFDKKRYQQTLLDARVNSVTTFATCHHGWAYYRGQAAPLHPGLDFDLLRAQFDACKEVDINVPIYLTAGVNNVAAVEHPEWRQIGPDGRLTGWAPTNIDAGFFRLCFNTGYLDYLCAQIREVVALFPTNDGIFLDIISQPDCVCHRCIKTMRETGLDPTDPADRKTHSRRVLDRYYRETTAAAKHVNPDNPVFHNSGHIDPGNPDILRHFSHLELESLPTGGWGYDHFPISAKYCVNLPHDYLGMTGKFHTTWGEFGGLKHPNALRYECAQMLAVGAKCSVGDQLHPNGLADESTYAVIGQAFREVEAKEPWCDAVRHVSDIGVLSSAAVNQNHHRTSSADVGAGRLLLEGQFLFDVLDAGMPFAGRKALLLPDDLVVDEALKVKIDAFLDAGGKVILSGTSGLKPDGSGFWWDIGAAWEGQSPFQPDYMLPEPEIRADFANSPLVMYFPSQRIRVTTGKSLGPVFDPYFNRSYDHFCSHQHAPNQDAPSGFDGGSRTANVLYFAHPVFSLYASYGAVAYRHFITRAIHAFLDGDLRVKSDMPSTARLHLNHQVAKQRHVLHLLSANTILRGGSLEMHGGTVRDTQPIQVIEELHPHPETRVWVRLDEPVREVTLEPAGEAIPFEASDGGVAFTVPSFTCHQMVCLR